MSKIRLIGRILLVCIIVLNFCETSAQFKNPQVYWAPDEQKVLSVHRGNIIETNIHSGETSILVAEDVLTPKRTNEPLQFEVFVFSPNKRHLLLFANTARVWRYHTRGDYWLLDLQTKSLRQIGRDRPSQSLQFAKFSPDNQKIAYVSEHNLFVEDIASGTTTQLTTSGTRKLINGTFDWAYEEEFGARDGFRWSDDSRFIAFWQVDAREIGDYYMLNTTDSIYSKVIPVEYPKAGEPPSPARIGLIELASQKIVFAKIPGDPKQHYLPRMEWVPGKDQIVVQQLNRKQNTSHLYLVKVATGESSRFYTETDEAFIDIKAVWNDGDPKGWDWIDSTGTFLWVSEKDGYRSIYTLNLQGREKKLTGNYDIAGINHIDRKRREVYFTASPDNPHQRYLYKVPLGGEPATKLSPSALTGTHEYHISPHARFAYHTFSNYRTLPANEWLDVQENKPLHPQRSILNTMKVHEHSNTRYFKVTTEDGLTLDGWMTYPVNFDSTKKYPVVFYVYGEPASSTIRDQWGEHDNFLFNGNLSIEGYFQISVDNRGTPSLRGREWRKSIYRRLGRLNVRDQAQAAQKILEKPWFDKERVAVWGWSGGGSTTLHLLFQYPQLYQTGIAIAPVTNLRYYDNIYEERYMGLPQENEADYRLGSAVHYAQNLEGNLLLIHGTADDNVHYSNAELLVDELVKHGKQFTFMAYPNRSHSLAEGEGTSRHLSNLYSGFLRRHCPPGPRDQ